MDAPSGYQSTLFGSARIELDVLHGIESGLELYEKISLIFLLYSETAVAQEHVALLILTQNKAPSILHDWACSQGIRWRETLVEALLIIQAFSDLVSLGLDIPKMKDHFLPHRLETSLFINPAKKVLYAICESHNKNDTKNLITSVSHVCTDLELEEIDFKYMELFILKLVRKKYISLGVWRHEIQNNLILEANKELCNIELFAKCLSRPRFEKFYDNLISAQKFINDEINSVDKTSNEYPETDDPFTSVVPATISANDCNFNFSSKPINENIIEKYKIIDSKNMGYFLVINQKKFQSGEDIKLEERLGTDFDVEKLTHCWSSFGFTVAVLENLPHHQIVPEITRYIKLSTRSHSAFAVCILSHGQNEVVYGSDSKPLEVAKIKAVLCSHYEVLICKPKLLIIQACRGDEMMRSVITKNVRTDSPIIISPEPADLLVFWATVANYVSYRDIKKGSWFIETLCDCLMKYGSKIHLSDLFTKVNNDLSEKKVQISQFESTWRKTLHLKSMQ